MTLWQKLAEEHAGDRPALLNAVALRLYDAHHKSAGQDAPPLNEREEVVRKTWIERARSLLRRIDA